VALGGGLALVGVQSASAHNPGITATCGDGLHLTANSYDASKANTWTYAVGTTTDSGTFGSDLDKTVALPQNGATTHVTATIQAFDGSYKQTFDQNVGPCGTPPPPPPSNSPTATDTVSVTDATCDAPGTASYTATHATIDAALNESVGAHTASFTSDDGYTFSTGSASDSKDYTIPGALGHQSTNPNAPCYTIPGSVTCVASSAAPDTEAGDLPPVLTNDGLVFDGPTAVGQARDLYYRVTAGNAQSLSDITVSYGAGSTGFPAQVVVEVSASAFPGSGFGTLSTNLDASQAVGTVNVSTSANWYSSKITSGAGSLAWISTGHSESYADLVGQLGTNHLLSAPSLHLQSAADATSHSLVTALSSNCGTHSYVTKVTPPNPPKTPTNPVAPHGINTGDVSPLVPWYPVAALLFLGLGFIALRARKSVATTK
jgi:hypothetical protein